MDYIKELKKRLDEEEACQEKHYTYTGGSVCTLMSQARISALKEIINLISNKEEWICCKDSLPPKRTLVMVKDFETDRSPRFRKRSYFGLRWLNSSGAYVDEIKPFNLWRPI